MCSQITKNIITVTFPKFHGCKRSNEKHAKILSDVTSRFQGHFTFNLLCCRILEIQYFCHAVLKQLAITCYLLNQIIEELWGRNLVQTCC